MKEILKFRSEDQRNIVTAIYKNYLMHYAVKNEVKTLIYGNKNQPFVYTIDAPTGTGKTCMAVESLRWISNIFDGQLEAKYYDIPLSLDDADIDITKLLQNVNDSLNYSSEEEKFLTKNILDEILTYDPSCNKLPLPLSEGSIAVYVRTRSQVKAFLNEASRRGLNAVALPSKSSVCQFEKASEITTIEGLESLEFSGNLSIDQSKKMLTQVRSNVDDVEIFGRKEPGLARLHARATQSCTKCPLNIKVATRLIFSKTEALKNYALDNANIHKTLGVPEIDKYLNKLSEYQREYLDLEESTLNLQKLYPNICPYSAIRDSLVSYSLIILTQPYLFDEAIFDVMCKNLQNVKHVLIDEAHSLTSLFNTFSSVSEFEYNSKSFVKLSKNYVEYTIEGFSNLDILISEQDSKLFDGNYSGLLNHEKSLLSSKNSELTGKALEDAAIISLADKGVFNNKYLIDICKKLESPIETLMAWIVLAYNRYDVFSSNMKSTINDKNLSTGKIIYFDEIMEILHGKTYVDTNLPILDKVQKKSSVPEIIKIYNKNNLQNKTLSVKNLANAYSLLKFQLENELLSKYLISNSVPARKLSKQFIRIAKDILIKVEELLFLGKSTISIYPQQFKKWSIGKEDEGLTKLYIKNNNFTKDPTCLKILTNEENKVSYPKSNWKIYYYPNDDKIEIIPLTLGNILADRFSNFKSVGLLSGTFPSMEYQQAFWGTNPYSFKTPNTVGKIKTYAVTGITTKWDDRNLVNYKKIAYAIQKIHKHNPNKHTFITFTSKAFMSSVMEHFTLEPNEFWPDVDSIYEVNVTDMIEDLDASHGDNKIYMAAMGSKFTEGVEFIDKNGASLIGKVICVGVPYAPPNTFNTDQKVFAQDLLQMDKWDVWSIFDLQNAFQKVRQSIGRGLRSDMDELEVYLIDTRYASNIWKQLIKLDGVIPIETLLYD